jgi:hypothetical protein
MKRNILVFGSIAGILICVFTIILTTLVEAHSTPGLGEILGYAAMILALSLTYVGVRNYRDKYNNGVISFGQAFSVAIAIALIASTFYVISWLVEFYVFMPDFMDKYAAMMATRARASHLDPVALQKKLAEIESMRSGYKNPVVVILYTYLEILPVGIIISLLTAILLKRKRRPAAVAPALA